MGFTAPDLFIIYHSRKARKGMVLIPEITACFTGHRILPTKDIPRIRRAVDYEIHRLYSRGVRNFLTGGAIGFDTLVIEELISMRLTLPEIVIVTVVPCRDQRARWSDAQKKRAEILDRSVNEFILFNTPYFDGCMQRRNEYMVDNSTHCISYCTKRNGGSYGTKRYAEKAGIETVELSGTIPFLD